MFASQTTKELKFGDHAVVIGKLSALQLERAQLERMKAVAPLLASMPPREISDRAEAQETGPRFATYDRQTVLMHGVHSIDGIAPRTIELQDLDQPTSDELFNAILELTLEGSEARKKD